MKEKKKNKKPLVYDPVYTVLYFQRMEYGFFFILWNWKTIAFLPSSLLPTKTGNNKIIKY